MKKLGKNWCFLSHCLLLAAILARWWHPVASSEALDLLHWARCVVLYRRIAMAIKTARKVGVYILCYVVDCHHCVRRSNTE